MGRFAMALASLSLAAASIGLFPAASSVPTGGYHFSAAGVMEGCGSGTHAATASVWYGNDGAYLIAAGDPALGGFIVSGAPETGFGGLFGGTTCPLVEGYTQDALNIDIQQLECDLVGLGQVELTVTTSGGAFLHFSSTANSGPNNNVCVAVDGLPSQCPAPPPVPCLTPDCEVPNDDPPCRVTITPCTPLVPIVGSATSGNAPKATVLLAPLTTCFFPPLSTSPDSKVYFRVNWEFTEDGSTEEDWWAFSYGVACGMPPPSTLCSQSNCPFPDSGTAGIHHRNFLFNDDTSNNNEEGGVDETHYLEIQEFLPGFPAFMTECLLGARSTVGHWENGQRIMDTTEIDYEEIKIVRPGF